MPDQDREQEWEMLPRFLLPVPQPVSEGADAVQFLRKQKVLRSLAKADNRTGQAEAETGGQQNQPFINCKENEIPLPLSESVRGGASIMLMYILVAIATSVIAVSASSPTRTASSIAHAVHRHHELLNMRLSKERSRRRVQQTYEKIISIIWRNSSLDRGMTRDDGEEEEEEEEEERLMRNNQSRTHSYLQNSPRQGVFLEPIASRTLPKAGEGRLQKAVAAAGKWRRKVRLIKRSMRSLALRAERALFKRFVRDQQQQLFKRYPDLHRGAILKKIEGMWEALPKREKDSSRLMEAQHSHLKALLRDAEAHMSAANDQVDALMEVTTHGSTSSCA